MKNEFESEIAWQSAETTPAGDPFMTVKKSRGYYYYAERGGVDSIAFILYDADRGENGEYGLIYEAKPPLDERVGAKHMSVTAFGGSIDMDKGYDEICQIEVLEEAGYDIPTENIHSVGSTLVSSQMSQYCFGYFVDVTGKTAGKTETDIFNEEQEQKDPDEFKHNKTIWLDLEGLMANNDWKSIWIFSKIFYWSMKNEENLKTQEKNND